MNITKTTQALKAGYHQHADPRAYHGWSFDPENPAEGPISCSLLKRYASLGPVAFRHTKPRPQTAAMSWGSLVDCLLFTPDLFPREFVTKEDCPHLSADGGFRSNAAKEWRDEQLADGATLITSEQKAEAETAVERLRNTPICSEIIEGADFQSALVSETSGVPLKALLDAVPCHLDHDDCLADLKTCSLNIYSDDAIARHVGQFKYHWQAAFYLDLWNKVNPTDIRRKFKLLFQSSDAPYECRVFELDEQWLDAGRAAVQFWLPRLIRDVKTGTFFSPWRNVETVLLPHTPSIWSEERQMEILEEVGNLA